MRPVGTCLTRVIRTVAAPPPGRAGPSPAAAGRPSRRLSNRAFTCCGARYRPKRTAKGALRTLRRVGHALNAEGVEHGQRRTKVAEQPEDSDPRPGFRERQLTIGRVHPDRAALEREQRVLRVDGLD